MLAGAKGDKGEPGEKGKRGLIGFIGYKGEQGSCVLTYTLLDGLFLKLRVSYGNTDAEYQSLSLNLRYSPP